jgi:hypothetical protein
MDDSKGPWPFTSTENPKICCVKSSESEEDNPKLRLQRIRQEKVYKNIVIPVHTGQRLTGSPDAKWLQVRDSLGNPTGLRKDGPHSPLTHNDPRAWQPHAHIPKITNIDGTPWLPIK